MVIQSVLYLCPAASMASTPPDRTRTGLYSSIAHRISHETMPGGMVPSLRFHTEGRERER